MCITTNTQYIIHKIHYNKTHVLFETSHHVLAQRRWAVLEKFEDHIECHKITKMN